MLTVLIVVLVLIVLYLIWRLMSDRRYWERERTQFQSKIDSANRLWERDHDQFRDICRRMWDGTPEQHQMLIALMDEQDARKEAEAKNIEPPPSS